jgi:MtrB/PioB family decaheme-associated outer membrane protein
MRAKAMILTALLASWGAPALGQPPATLPGGTLNLGVRFTDVSGDEARYQRFRDLGDGAFLDRFTFGHDGGRWLLQLAADHAGRRDQRYTARFRHSGGLTVAFEWDQVPLLISRDTRTLFSSSSPGVLRIGDSIQQGLQSGQLGLADVVSRAQVFETKSRRDIARVNVRFSPRRDVDLKLDLANTQRGGTTPLGTMFASSNVVEVTAPIDTRTTDLGVGVEWTGSQGSLRVGYDGSWFDNRVSTLAWDNPLALTDSLGAPGEGRYALSPDSTLTSVGAAGGWKFPANTRATGSVSVGRWRQNEALLPFTVNSALPSVPLARPTADARARTLAMAYDLTSRPTPYVWLNARYRYYDFDNRTPVFDLQQYVRYDQGIVALPQERGSTRPLSVTRQNLDVDTSFTPLPFSAIRVGYSRDWTDRTHRIFERTTENTGRVSLDSTRPGWLTVRAIGERSRRTGAGLQQEALTVLGEQPAMRHYDVADRTRNQVTGLVQITPSPSVGLSASAAVGNDDYSQSGFGLRDSKRRVYSATLDVTPGESVAAGLSYSHERYTAWQNSRSAAPGPQFDDPTRNWATDSADKVQTVTANVDLLQLPRRSELHLAYDFTRSRATYVYVLPTAGTLLTPQQLPPVLNELRTGTADFRIAMSDRLAIGLMYWYDRYNVDDFQLGPGTINRLDLPGSLLLGYVYRPYTANSGWLRLIVAW